MGSWRCAGGENDVVGRGAEKSPSKNICGCLHMPDLRDLRWPRNSLSSNPQCGGARRRAAAHRTSPQTTARGARPACRVAPFDSRAPRRALRQQRPSPRPSTAAPLAAPLDSRAPRRAPRRSTRMSRTDSCPPVAAAAPSPCPAPRPRLARDAPINSRAPLRRLH